MEKYHGDFSDDESRFAPFLDEVITVPVPTVDGSRKEKVAKESEKKAFDVKSIVGRRVNVYWPTKKQWYKATVIGYTSNLQSNLLFYDDLRSPEVSLREDYRGVPFRTASGVLILSFDKPRNYHYCKYAGALALGGKAL